MTGEVIPVRGLIMGKRLHVLLRTAALAYLLLGSPARAEDWPMFGRDRSRNAVSPEKDPPRWWQVEVVEDGKVVRANRNVRWSAKLGTEQSYYRSYGDPVVADGLVWIGTNATAQVGGEEQPHYAFRCFDEKSGKPLWSYLSPQYPLLGRERWLHTMASSPLPEGDRMWFYNNRSELVCLDLPPLRRRRGEPREVWKVDVRKQMGVYRARSIFDGRVASTATDGDRLYVATGNGVNNWDRNLEVNASAPSLVCFDKNTGKLLWQDRSPGGGIIHSQFASPTLATVGGATQVIAPQGDGWVRAFEAATGKLIWAFNTNPPDALGDSGRGKRNYLPATAVFHEGRVYIGNGREPEHDGGEAWLYCIDPGKRGDVSPHLPDGPGRGKPNPNSGMVWKYGGRDPKTRSVVFHRTLSNVAISKGLLIAADTGGRVHCLDAHTGTPHWVHEMRGVIQGCPLIADRLVYVGNDEGTLSVFELSARKTVVETIDMPWPIRSSPVYANGVLYVAAGGTLYAIAGGEKKLGK